jgi:hypothetical protein
LIGCSTCIAKNDLHLVHGDVKLFCDDLPERGTQPCSKIDMAMQRNNTSV